MRRKVLSLVLALCMVLSLMPMTAFAAPGDTFNDVDGHWGQSAIERWSEYGVVNGDGTGGFAPDKQMTRAEFATMLANMLGYKDKAANTFADVNDSDWFADAILKLAAAGVIQGSNGMANPNAPISRQEAAVMMCRAFNIPTTGGNLDFADSADVADWAKGAVAALADRGMMNGVGNNNVAPLADINRASVATLLDNMITEYVTEDKTITGEVSGIVLVAADATVTVENATLNENLIVAPKADGAEVALTGTTTASDVVVGATATVKVESTASAGTVQVAAANSTVEVAGKADAVTVDSAANNTAVNVTESAAVGDVALNAADTKVSVAENASVSNVAVSGSNANVEVSGKVDNVTVSSGATGTGITANSGATVGKVDTSANDVTVSGSGKVENVTANDGTVSVTTPGTSVENKTDSKDNVTNNGKPVEPSTGGSETPTPPSGGGSSGGGTTTPAKKYNVSIGTVTGGTVTADPAGSDEAGTVTLTVTPQAGYVLHELTLTPPEGSSANVTPAKDNETAAATQEVTFTTDEEGTYTVTAKFVQPLKGGDFQAFIVTPATYKDLPATFKNWEKDSESAQGNPNYNETTGWSNLATNPWLAIVATQADEYSADRTGTIAIKFAGSDVTKPTGWGSNVIGSHGALTAYVGDVPDGSPAGDKLGVTEDVGDFTITLTYKGITYTKQVPYVAGDATAYTITYMDGTTKLGTQTVKGSTAITPNTSSFTKVGYDLNGKLYTNKECTTEWTAASSGITEDTTLYVKWDAKTFTATYNANEGTGSVSGTSATYNTEFTFAAGSGLTRDGYTFAGWATSASATEATYKAGDKITWNFDANQIFYAVWTPTKHTVTFKVDGTEVYKVENVAYGTTTLDAATTKALNDAVKAKYPYTVATVPAFNVNDDIEVTVTLKTDVESLITVTPANVTFGGAFGNTVKAETIQNITFALEKNEKGQIVVNGELYLTEWPEFSSVDTEKKGYYAALSLPATIQGYADATVAYNNGEAVKLTSDVPPFITIMGGADAQDFTNKGVKLVIDLDGAGGPITPAEYVFNFSAVKAVDKSATNPGA